jgi:hypothetical protein
MQHRNQTNIAVKHAYAAAILYVKCCLLICLQTPGPGDPALKAAH